METDAHRYKELSDFLKTRRARVMPSQAGLPPGPRRRTPGLRREEVAQLAGIGLTWYTWLEQGRPIRVSAQVLESLSRVLLLDRQERLHLFHLANQAVPTDMPDFAGTASPVLQRVLDSLRLCPSLVVDRRWNVLAWNEESCALFGDFSGMNARQRNVVWAVFTEPRYKKLLVDWEANAKALLGRFRTVCGKLVEDPWLVRFVGDLKEQSEEFLLWWPLHEIQGDNEVRKRLDHPVAGILDFEVSLFDVGDAPGLKLIVHTPLPGTETAEKMRSLSEAHA